MQSKVTSLGQRLRLLGEHIANKKDIKTTEFTTKHSTPKYSTTKHSEGKPSVSRDDDDDSKFEFNDLFEIARVEGYDDTSYITSLLKDIRREISNNELTAASTKINQVITDVMPFDYEQFFQLYKATQQTADRLHDKVCWVLLGPTGAGKSTSIHFLCGSHFKQGNGGDVIVDHVHDSLANKDIEVGQSVIESKTRYIAEVELDLTRYDIPFGRNEPKQVLCVDSPGFEDTAGPEVNMANGIGTIRALKRAKAVKVIITFKEAHLDYRFHIIRNIANNMGKALNGLEYELDKHGSPISGFLTKSVHGIKSAQTTFGVAYEEQEKKKENSNDNALFKALIYKLGKKGPLHEIKIDVDNPQINAQRRMDIVKSLVTKTGYIEAPNQSFTEFISEATLSKLKQQIELNYGTIQNILDHDEYFENRMYIQYIVDILNNMDKLKGIIKTAGGKFVESRFTDCMALFKAKWNQKIAKAQTILTNMELKQCSIRSMTKRLREFGEISDMMTENVKVIKGCKYYKELKDVNCLNEGLHSCFDELYRGITDYLNGIVHELKSDDNISDTDVEDAMSPSSNVQFEYNAIDNTYHYDKLILLSIKKCCLLKQYKKDKYIRKKFKEFEKLIDTIIQDLQRKCDNLIHKKEALNANNVPIFMFLYSSLSKVHHILMAKDTNMRMNERGIQSMVSELTREQTEGEEYEERKDESKDDSSQVIQIIKHSIIKLKGNVEKTIKSICTSYSLNATTLMTTGADKYVDVDALFSKVIKTDDYIRKREHKLTAFCSWLSGLMDALSDSNMVEMYIFRVLQTWLTETKNKFIMWLSGACIEELKMCNNLLIEKQAESWNDVEKVLNECKSLRKVEDISNNTSQEFFRTLSEFDFSKTALAKQAAELIDVINDDEKDTDYDRIIRIANQLYRAGCSNESSEMKQIYNRLNQHLKSLRCNTEAFVLSIETYDDLTKIQNTMNELDTLQKFADFMPDIKNDANECYKILNHQVLDILKEVNAKYDLAKCSTQSSRDLKEKLKAYSNLKHQINAKVLNDVIMQCSFASLTQLMDDNESKMNTLRHRNKSIKQIIEEQGGTMIKQIEEYTKMHQKGKVILVNLGVDDLNAFLHKVGFGNLKEIKSKLDELQKASETICCKEREEEKNNNIEMDTLHKMNPIIQQCVELENDLISLNVETATIIELRRNNTFLQNSIIKLEELLQGNQNYLFTQKLALHDAYHALQFLSKCKDIKWNLSHKIKDELVLSNKYIAQINVNVSKYLRAYGEYLEISLNDLLRELAITDISECDLNDIDYRNSVSNAISKLNDCLREFRDISSFDLQMKMQMEDSYNEKPPKQLKLVSRLFANHDIQLSIDNYINNTISVHKGDIIINFNRWKTERPETLPILHFICLSMSSLDRYISSKQDQEQTYYRIASTIDGELNKELDDNTKQIIPLFENGHWARLREILENLQRTANVNKHGAAQRSYRNAVMKLVCALSKLMAETKTKLLIDINKENDVNAEKILALNDGLKAVRNLVEIISSHLKDETEKKKVKKEENALGLLLSDRLHHLMRAALQSVKRRDFKQCEKRLDNVSKLMDYNTQCYIPVTMTDHKEEKESPKEYGNKIVVEYDKTREEISNVLDEIRKQVDKANKDLSDPNVFNPYNKLKLISLHSQLAKSQNEQFTALWDNIYDDITTTISNILNKIKERSNQLQMQNVYLNRRDENMMSHEEQTKYLQKIKMSLSLFPDQMKETIKASLQDTEQCAAGNTKYIEEGFERSVEANAWNEIARCLHGFQQNNTKLFNKSRRILVTKINTIYNRFNENMKSMKGFEDNLNNELDSYQSIARCFTTIQYESCGANNDNNNINITHVDTLLKQMYRDIDNRFISQCKDVKSSLTGHKPYKLLQNGFLIIIKVLERKDKLPTNVAQSMMEESRELLKPIQKLVNTLKTRKNQGLDRNSHDVEPLITVLNDIKMLTEAEFHSNIRKFIPMMNKKGENKLEKTIENIEYDIIKKETKDMLTEFKDTVSRQGLNKNMIQQNQAKRLGFLKQLALKIKALFKFGSKDVCEQHLEVKQDDFEKIYIKPCTKTIATDIKKMQKETNNAFTKQTLNVNDLQRANANLEAFYAVKNVFEKQIDDDKLFNEIKVDEAIVTCTDTATQRVNGLTKEIQNTNINQENIDEYMEKSAEILINLEYLNNHINFKTSINDEKNDEKNELHQHIKSAIKRSMNFLTKDKNTKKKINVLYNHLIGVDSNYGTMFTQQHSVFKASINKTMNQKFRELDIIALIENLKQSEKQIKKKHDLIGIDWDKITWTIQDIVKKYESLIMENLRSAKSFKDLEQENIAKLANDAKGIAVRAVRSKSNWLQGVSRNVTNYVKHSFSWLTGQNAASNTRDNPRNYYWTNEMMKAASDIMPYILAIWTLRSASCYYESDDKSVLMKARNAQIVAICCLLCLDIDAKHKLINNLVEVGTGEGKSVIMAVTAITMALLDFDVYCACYSELLSKRDEDAFNDLFVLFGVQNHVHYQTFNNIFEQVINDGGDIREITKQIVLSKDLDDDKNDCKMDDTEEQKRLLQKRQKILFIDEVDKFFSTDFFGKQYTPSCIIPNHEMKNLILFVWEAYLSNDCKGSAITIKMIEESNEYKALFAAFDNEWHDLLKESIKDIVDGIRTFKDDTYKLENGRNICYKFSDTYSSKVFYGYRTIFAYLHELNDGNITDEAHVHQQLTWFLKCGSFSYSEIPCDFYAILGVTGTLNSLSPKEHHVMQKSYGVKKYVVMPSLFDKRGKLDYAKNKDFYILKSEHFLNQLQSTIQLYRNNDIATIQRPIIVFFKNENKLNYFYNLEVCKTWRINDVIQKLTPDLTTQEKHTGILNATKSNMITFATEEYGRGIDFKVFDKKLDVKGMHIELTYWPETLAEEIQIKGRTARQGQRGSFHIILNEDEIIDQCNVSSRDIKIHQDNGDLYEWLNEIRNQVFAKQYDEASNYVEQLRPIHKESEELAMSLRQKNVKIAKQKLLLFNKGANIQSAAKLSIIIDSTGSMYSCLNQCKIVIQKTIPKLVAFLQRNGIDAESFEIQIIGYRNYNADADNILEFCSFTSNENELTKFVHSLSPDYGWGPEAIEVAFGQLNRQKKKPNIVMLMADAPAHTKADIQTRRQQSRGEAYWQNARDGIFGHILDWKEELDRFMQQNVNANVFCFYLNNGAKSNFDEIGTIGKGKSMYLNVNDEQKSIALLQSALSETILLKMNNGNMEMVDLFRKQNQNIPTFL